MPLLVRVSRQAVTRGFSLSIYNENAYRDELLKMARRGSSRDTRHALVLAPFDALRKVPLTALKQPLDQLLLLIPKPYG